MIEVQTDRPVYSNAKGGKTRLFNKKLTEDQKLARKKRLTEKAKGIYGKAKESGILSSLENLALGNMKSQTGTESEVKIPTEIETLPPRGWSSYSKTKKGVIITSSIVVVGIVVYFAAFRKKK